MRPYTAAAILIGFGLATVGHAGDTKTWQDIGEFGGPVLWGASLVSPLIQDGHAGWSHAKTTFDAMLIDGVLTEGLKYTVREKRPDSNGRDSFPSLHASLSFAAATAQASLRPGQAVFWYGAATVIAYSRVPAHEHRWQDVVAGALLGYACGRIAASSPHGSLGAPAFERSYGPGLFLTRAF